jgi:hypothetical protein
MMQHLEEIVVPGEFISVLGECIHMLQHLEEMVVLEHSSVFWVHFRVAK